MELQVPSQHNATIGLSEGLTERMFGELNEKQEENLKDLPSAIENALIQVRRIP